MCVYVCNDCVHVQVHTVAFNRVYRWDFIGQFVPVCLRSKEFVQKKIETKIDWIWELIAIESRNKKKNIEYDEKKFVGKLMSIHVKYLLANYKL